MVVGFAGAGLGGVLPPGGGAGGASLVVVVEEGATTEGSLSRSVLAASACMVRARSSLLVRIVCSACAAVCFARVVPPVEGEKDDRDLLPRMLRR